MMLVRLVLTALAGLIAFLILVLDHVWPDKRTKRHKLVRCTLIWLMAAAIIPNMVVVWHSEKTGNKLTQTIADLKLEVATLENQNKQLIILERMQRYITTDHDTLARKYPKGYFLFAANKYTVIPSSKDALSSFTLDWDSSRIQLIDPLFIYITLKNFCYLPLDIIVQNLNIVLRRQVGAVAEGISFNNIGLYVELLDERAEDIIYVIGFRSVEAVPGLWDLEPDVQAFIKKIDYPGVAIRIDTNINKNITIQDWIICSGWKATTAKETREPER